MTVLDAELIKLVNYFEKRTGARVREVFYDKLEKLTFIVEPGDAGKAIGKGARTLKGLEKSLGKRIRVAEFSEDRLKFIQNLVAPLRLEKIEELPEGVIMMYGGDEKTNGLLIGKQARNLRNLEWMVRKYYPVPEIRVE